MFNLEQEIQHWRNELIAAGLQTDIIDELESHLMHAFDDWKVAYNEKDAFARAVENLGTPATILDSFTESVSLPLTVKFSISYVVLLGVGMAVLASLSLDNPAFEYGLAFCGALPCYCAYWLIRKLSYSGQRFTERDLIRERS